MKTSLILTKVVNSIQLKYLTLSKQEMDHIVKSSEEEAIKMTLGIASQPPPPIPEFDLPEDKLKDAESLADWIDDIVGRQEPSSSEVDDFKRPPSESKSAGGFDDLYSEEKEKHVEISDEDREKECEEMKVDYNVVIGVSWGNLPYDLQDRWRELKCDSIFE